MDGRKTASVEGKRYFEQGFGQRFSTASSRALTRRSQLQENGKEFRVQPDQNQDAPSGHSLVARLWTSFSERLSANIFQ